MIGQLQEGTFLFSDSSNKYEVVKMFDPMGFGEVYDVECNGQHFELVWYRKQQATRERKEELYHFISEGSPNGSFLWPMDVVFTNSSDSFGYITQQIPNQYASVVDMMKRRVEPSFYILCRAAYNLVNSHKKLHEMGYHFLGFGFDGVYFNPDTGEVLLRIFEKVATNGENPCCDIGTPQFMAPETVVCQSNNSRATDLYSLSVLLFYMFMLGHPLEGRLETELKVMDFTAMRKLYATNPIFVFDPKDESNRPVRGYHDNVLVYWSLYPKHFRDLFTRAFTVGLKYPGERVTEDQWINAITRLMNGITNCSCGAEVFFDKSKVAMGQKQLCWNCGKEVCFINLKEVFEKYPYNTQSRARLLSLLHDLYPLERPTVNIVMTVFDSGMTSEIKEMVSIDPLRKATLIKRLVNEYGLQEQNAEKGIELWLEAFGVIEHTKTVYKSDKQEIFHSYKLLSRPNRPLAFRQLEIYWVIGCSGNLHGLFISEINHAIQSILPDLQEISEEYPIRLMNNVLAFSSGAKWITQDPVDIGDFEWEDLDAGGVTDLGHAYKMLEERLSETANQNRNYPPVVILVLGNLPTDDYQRAWQSLKSLSSFQDSMRIGIPIGDDTDVEILKQFAGNPELVLSLNQLKYLPKLIKYPFHS